MITFTPFFDLLSLETAVELTLARLILIFIAAFVATFLTIPSVVQVAKAKGLYDMPNGRTSHSEATPTLGGIAIFTSVVLSLLLFFSFDQFPDIQYVLAGTVILSIIGIKDDMTDISAKKKLFGQIAAVLLVVLMGDIRFTSLHGFLGIYDIALLPSVLLTVFVSIVIINCINLIDGIDGLASGVSIIAFSTFGVWFFLVQEYQYAVLSAAIVGSLVAFFKFNVRSKRFKIFMGDTGSLTLGFFISIMVIHFNETNLVIDSPYQVAAAPAVSFGVLIVPLFDTLRVFILRAVKKRSPFKPDKQHVHHRILKLGLTHLNASLILMGFNLLFVALVFSIGNWPICAVMATILTLGCAFSLIPVYLLKRKESRQKAAENHSEEPVRLNNKKIKVEMNTNGNGNSNGNGSNRKQLKRELKSV